MSALGRPCSDRRIADRGTLAAEVAAWVTERTAAWVALDWQFTSTDARITLKPRYPALLPST